ncbi:MAG TPA: hypothetical protein VL025_13505 [Thermoanaerobaculia bacterium]|nr:hypothetical protein [Thermoanaerobaculia bacterium]
MTRMTRSVKRRLTTAVFTAVLLIPAAVAAEPTRAERQPGGGFLAQSWTFLVSLWSEVGGSLDPFGAEINSDNGPGLDPNGLDADNGPGLDPNGLDADTGSGLDPNGGS